MVNRKTSAIFAVADLLSFIDTEMHEEDECAESLTGIESDGETQDPIVSREFIIGIAIRLKTVREKLELSGCDLFRYEHAIQDLLKSE